MRTKISILVGSLVITYAVAKDLSILENRFLQQGPPPQNQTGPPPPGGRPPIPKVYGENVTISFKANLGCGACIRGNYIYCIPGAEGSTPA